ncbi:hypothetical protein [Nostoc sp. C052]|nr:hypothetical protein [Nostoc sp. C052]
MDDLKGVKGKKKLEIWEMLSRYWEMLNVVGEDWEFGDFVEIFSNARI